MSMHSVNRLDLQPEPEPAARTRTRAQMGRKELADLDAKADAADAAGKVQGQMRNIRTFGTNRPASMPDWPPTFELCGIPARAELRGGRYVVQFKPRFSTTGGGIQVSGTMDDWTHRTLATKLTEAYKGRPEYRSPERYPNWPETVRRLLPLAVEASRKQVDDWRTQVKAENAAYHASLPKPVHVLMLSKRLIEAHAVPAKKGGGLELVFDVGTHNVKRAVADIHPLEERPEKLLTVKLTGTVTIDNLSHGIATAEATEGPHGTFPDHDVDELAAASADSLWQLRGRIEDGVSHEPLRMAGKKRRKDLERDETLIT